MHAFKSYWGEWENVYASNRASDEKWRQKRNAASRYSKEMVRQRRATLERASRAIGGHPGMVEVPSKKLCSALRRPKAKPKESSKERAARIRALLEKKEKVRADKCERREALWLASEEGQAWLAEMEAAPDG